MTKPPVETGAQPAAVDPKRHPAALSDAISKAWRPYRWRGYAVGILAGLFAGGVVAPVVTTSLLLASFLAGAAPSSVGSWPEIVWSITFAVTVPAAAATAFTRWQPRLLRDAAETYLWLAHRAEVNWARVFGSQPIPRTESRMRAFLETVPHTPATAGERFGLSIGLLDLDGARAALADMTDATAGDRYARTSAAWLVDFIGGTTGLLEPLESLIGAIEDPDDRIAASVELAVMRARVALADGQDWRVPLATVRPQLGTAPAPVYHQTVWRPVFRSVLINAVIGATVFWVASFALGPFFPVPR